MPIFLQYVCLRSGGKSLGIPARCRDENVLPGGFAEAKASMLYAALCLTIAYEYRDLSVKLFKKPRHILAEVPESCDAFLVIHDLTGVPAETEVPVTRARDDHMAYTEEVVDA